MSMLSRYQKAGGFIQLVQLIETTGKAKQENFLNIIDKEGPRWAEALREKMLTMDKILSWDDQVLAEIAARLQELTLATAVHGLKPEDSERLLKTFTHSQRRNIDDIKNSKVPSPAEQASAFNKILVEVRSMITNGYIRVDKFAPDMVIPEDFEQELGKPGLNLVRNEPSSTPNMDSFGGSPSGQSTYSAHGQVKSVPSAADTHEVNALRSKINTLTSENNMLKAEIKVLREKLAQIRKIA